MTHVSDSPSLRATPPAPPLTMAREANVAIMTSDRQSYVDWPSIFAGAALATAVSYIMLGFGAGIGLSLVSPEPREGLPAVGIAVATGIWFVWVAVSSFAAGGYIAGRLRCRADDATADERATRDGAHGLVVWAVGAIVAAVMAAFGIAGVVGTASEATPRTGGAIADRLIEAGVVDLQFEASALLRPGEDEGFAAPAEGAQDEVALILGRALRTGELAQADRSHLASRVAQWTGVSTGEAEARIDDTIGTVFAVRDEAIEAADRARRSGIIVAFVIAATLAVSAAAAWAAASLGGTHRDAGIFIAPSTRL